MEKPRLGRLRLTVVLNQSSRITTTRILFRAGIYIGWGELPQYVRQGDVRVECRERYPAIHWSLSGTLSYASRPITSSAAQAVTYDRALMEQLDAKRRKVC